MLLPRKWSLGLYFEVGFLDIIDILLITVLLYHIYKWLIGSRAWNLLRGIALLGGGWFLAAQLGLPASAWLFDKFVGAAFIAVVIIFQPELRAILENFGRGSAAYVAIGDPVKEVMSTVRNLASQNRGAIIAIEKRVPLEEYGRVGSKLNSPVSSALLETIFDSKGPLHDGAVIIKNDVITYAGAIFPVSNRIEGVPASHGTRHRAALGLSEKSDALAIVVSEERGTVSLAKEGQIKSDIAPTEVLKALREVYRS